MADSQAGTYMNLLSRGGAPTMQPRAVLFDFDFTLADSSEGAIACVTYALASLGLPAASPDRICATIGLPMAATLASLTGRTDPDLVTAFSQHFIAHADAVMADLTRLYPEVPAVVQTLQQAGVALGIVSSKLRYRIEGIAVREGLRAYFPVIVGAEDVAEHKPHPAGLAVALQRLGCPPEAAMYVGDHPVDAEAAARAGLPFVAVLTGVSQREQFRPYPVVAFLNTVAALPRLLKVGGVSERAFRECRAR